MNPYVDRLVTAFVAGLGAAAAVLATMHNWAPIVAAGVGGFAAAFLGGTGAHQVNMKMRRRAIARDHARGGFHE